jgi:quercetin dioxygenase-like cupin family protein
MAMLESSSSLLDKNQRGTDLFAALKALICTSLDYDQRANMNPSKRVLPLMMAGLSLTTMLLGQQAFAQAGLVHGCTPIGQRIAELGCWSFDDQPIGVLTKAQIFWHLDVYPTRVAAEADKGPRSTIVESLGKIWLLTIDDEDWHPAKGQRIAKIGPLPITAGEGYSAQYMEAIFTPGMTSPIHTHSGPEAFYTLTGETCLETPEGAQTGRAGGPPVIVAGGVPMHLTATGSEKRSSLVLILHLSSKPSTSMVHDWAPKGLCKATGSPGN